MANRTLFVSKQGKLAAHADTANEAGGRAYRLSDKQALAQYAATGCLSDVQRAAGVAEQERGEGGPGDLRFG